jgi:HD-GYP domain-containing protein (c-di-GMP phosphodiesterase class II)
MLIKLELLAVLHDIGKMSINKDILEKDGQLTESEWLEIQKHPESGYRIASASPELKPVAYYILCHHERWDGSGYPYGLKGEDIPLLSRIIAVVDTYDAITHDRSYRKAKQREFAIDEIRKNSGVQFDPKIVDAFLNIKKMF